MRVLISGDRKYKRGDLIYALLHGVHKTWLESGPDFDGDEEPFVVIEGEAPGADTLAREAAEKLGFEVDPYPAKWDEYGRAAGPIRNKQMLDEGKPDVVFCFHDSFEQSRGTKNMAEQADKAGVPVYVISRYSKD